LERQVEESMAELRENSILFSLNGLLDRERQRVTQEAEQECRRIEAERLERLACERRLIEEQELARLELEERARREEERRREQAARIEALRKAEIVRARAEADGKARIELDAKHREHELRLLGIREQVGRRRAEQLTLGCAIVTLLTWAAGAWLYFGEVSPERERVRAEYETLLGDERARSQELRHLVEVSDRRNAELAASLKRALEQPAQSGSAEPAWPSQKPVPKAGGPGATRDGKRPHKAPPKSGRPCPDNRDPLDNCL
jgi:colicin import membrane protein